MIQTDNIDRFITNDYRTNFDSLDRHMKDLHKLSEVLKNCRVPVSDAQNDDDINDLHQKRIIPTEPGESIEVKYITDTQNVQVCQS